MLFSTAFAQTAAGGGSDFQAQLVQFAPLIMIAGVFYFLLIRPQQQRAKQLKTALSGLRRGDKIITAGGIIASITRVVDDEKVEVEIAPGVKVSVLRSTISTILSKPEPAAKGKAGKVSETGDAASQTIEGEAVEIDADADASSRKRRPPTKGAVAKAAEAAPAEIKPTDTPK